MIGEPVSIGRPLPNTTCYILDEAGEPVPVGQRGTLYVGGAGVAKGYINLPLTTAEKFQPDKFANDGYAIHCFPLMTELTVLQHEDVQLWQYRMLESRWFIGLVWADG